MFIIDDLMALFAVAAPEAAAATATAEAAAATATAAEIAAAAEAAQIAAAAEVAAAEAFAAGTAGTAEAATAAGTAEAATAAASKVPASFFEQQLALNPSTMTANPGASLELASNAPGVNAEMDAVMRFGQNAPQLIPTAPTGPAVPSVPAPTAKLASYGAEPASQFSLSGPTTPSPFSLSNSPMPMSSTYAKMPMTEGVQPGIFDSVKAGWSSLSPLEKGAAMYMGASKLGMFDQGGAGQPPPEEPMSSSKYRLSKDFQPSVATPRVYQPDYTQYAAEGGVMSVGGVTSYKRGGTGKSYDDSLEYYKNMIAPQEGKGPVPDKGDVGIYHDMDQDTRYQDALTAAQIRQSKINKRANLQMPTGGVMQRPTPMGQLNLSAPGSKAQQGSMDMTNAAGGGIMSLGGYAAGGNPRLLKGPGDGMSDNIPATIGNKQPARLADGEFVIPADVVSHLGNGSTEAGAKRLHEMMTKVRSARTGNSKQGKQINASKYIPK